MSVRLSPLQLARRAARVIRSRVSLGGALMHGPPKPEVAITFDDGPSRAHTPKILDILRENDARATFFLLGEHAAAEPAIARRIAAEQEVGCHSYSHTKSITESLDAFRADIAKCKTLFARELGVTPRYFRFPWGHRGLISPRDVLALEGMLCVHWSASSGDELHDGATVTRNAVRALEPGAILLFHDGMAKGSIYARDGVATVEALPAVLRAIKERGLRAVSVGDLLGSPR